MSVKSMSFELSRQEGPLGILETRGVNNATRKQTMEIINEKKIPISQAKILMAEDEGFLRDLLSEILDTLGVNVSENIVFVTSGDEMIAKIQEGYIPNLLLSDNEMPGINGSEALAFLTQNGKIDKNKTFVVMQTGTADNLQAQKNQIGAHHILGKPYMISDLRRILSERFSGL